MATQPVVLLIGRSLTLTAIAAGLRDRPELTVRQVDAWLPRLTAEAAPDVVIVDGSGAEANAGALLAACPHVLLLAVGAGAQGGLMVTMHHSEQRPLGNGHDLVSLILDHAQADANAAANDMQVTGTKPRPTRAGDGAAPMQQNQDQPSTTARRVP